MRIISADEIRSVLTWEAVVNTLRHVHNGPRPMGDSYYIGDPSFGLFSRGVILPKHGAGFKVVSINAENSSLNPPLPTEDGAFILLDEQSKALVSILDSPEITRWKTAGDSALAASMLSRENSSTLLVLGAGPISNALVEAYLYIRPSIHTVLLWNRTASKIQDFANHIRLSNPHLNVEVTTNLKEATPRADIVASATSSMTPLIFENDLKEGVHIDLVGGFRKDMQEAEASIFAKARIFVDDYENALESGDIAEPLAKGFITESDIEGDLFQLCQQNQVDRTQNEITIFKNAGSAYLDLAISQLVSQRLSNPS
jgi:ornithine cyclodeaminase/alanine dehydrogenase-like protein (mu-crystallin family)